MTSGGGSGMRRTTVGDLAVPFLIIGIAVYVLLRFSYDNLPPLQYPIAVPIAALAAVEFWMARRVRAAVRHDPEAKMMQAIAIARCVALGKASSLVGAGVLGAAIALLLRVLPDATSISAAAHDSRVATLMAVASAVLVAAGLVLERAGIDPGQRGGTGHGAGQRL